MRPSRKARRRRRIMEIRRVGATPRGGMQRRPTGKLFRRRDTRVPGLTARITEAPPPGWDALLGSDPNATPAHRPEVGTALAQATAGFHLRFVAVEDDRGLCGG